MHHLSLLVAFFLGLTEGLPSQFIPEAHFENLPSVVYINEPFQFNVTWEEINGNATEAFAEMGEEHLILPFKMGHNFATFNYTFTNVLKTRIEVFGFMVTHQVFLIETGHYTIVIKPARVRSESSSTTTEPAMTTPSNVATKPSKNSNELAVGIVIAILVFACVIGAAIIYFRNKSKRNPRWRNHEIDLERVEVENCMV